MNNIFLIHGMWCTAAHLNRVTAEFEAGGARCYVLTLPGHESAPASRDAANRADFSETLAWLRTRWEEWSATVTGPRVLFGHSLGGLYAQALAAQVSRDALILFSPVAPAGVPALAPGALALLAPLFFRSRGFRRPHRPTRAAFARYVNNGLPRTEQSALWETFVHQSGPATYQATLGPLFGGRQTVVRVGRVRCPVFIAAGQLDRITPPRVQRQLAQLYRDTSLYEYAATSHWMITEHELPRIMADVRAWLAARVDERALLIS